MNEIAIYFQKITLGEGRFIFKPIDIIRGNYDAEEETFVTTAGKYYEPIFGGSVDGEDFFGYLTTTKKLKEKYSSKLNVDELLFRYFEENLSYIYIGYINDDSYTLSFVRIPFDKIQNLINKDMEKLATISEPTFTFNKEGLINIRNSETLELVRKKIDIMLSIANGEPLKEFPNINPESKKEEKISLKELREEVLSKIVGQDTAVNDVTRCIMINQTSTNPKNKSHILITGPTGTGKTEIVKIICDTLNLPYFEADATAYTKEGYVGKSVYSMLDGLKNAANGNILDAQKGILVIDEIDKKVFGDQRSDIAGKDVLYSLLKMMDRSIIELNNDSPFAFGPSGTFDTSNLTIILMGAFEGVYQSKLKENDHYMGFGSSKPVLDKKEIILTKDDIIKSGMPSEFLGRIGEITSTTAFEVQDLINILNNSSISALKIQKEYFKETFGVDLITTDDYIEEIARQAIKYKTNARELKPLIRNSLKYAVDEFLMGRNAKVLKLTKETVVNPRKYYID